MAQPVYQNAEAHDDDIWCCCWRTNEEKGDELIATGSLDCTVKLWKWTGNSCSQNTTFDGHNLGIISVDIDKFSRFIVSTSLDSSIRVWDIATGVEKTKVICPKAEAWSVSFSPDGSVFATAAQGGTVRMYDVNTGEQVNTLETKGRFVMSLAFSPDGRYLACGSTDGVIHQFDMVNTHKSVNAIEAHSVPIRALRYSRDSALLVSGGDDGYVKVFNANEAKMMTSLTGHQAWVTCAAFCPDNIRLATGSADKTVRLWDVQTRECTSQFQNNSIVWGVSFNAWGNLMAAVSADRSLNIYETPAD